MSSFLHPTLELFKQNVLIEDVIDSSTEHDWSVDNLCEKLLSNPEMDFVSPSYKAKFAREILNRFANTLSEDTHERLMEIVAKSFSYSSQQLCIVEYGGTKVRVLDPYTTAKTTSGDAQVGLRLWEAEICVLEWLEANSEMIENKDVVELGAGVGLAGLAAAERLGAKSVTLTDTSAKVLENLQINVQTSKLAKVKASVVCLDWHDEVAARAIGDHQFIIAADCVYDPNDVPAFVQTLEILLKRTQGIVALVASSIRNRKTFDKLLTELSSTTVNIQETAIPANHQRYSNRAAHMFTRNWERTNVVMHLLSYAT
jgi:predicted nicotinamide N-methyase